VTTVSKYLRRPSRPRPRFLLGDTVQTSCGPATISAISWAEPTVGEPHWRYGVRMLSDDLRMDCAEGNLEPVPTTFDEVSNVARLFRDGR
jgi:hypothetical protein